MHTIRLGTLSLCFVMAIAAVAHAQPITITSTDVGTFFAAGKTISRLTDKVAKSINIGAPGATSWDFSALRTDSTTTLLSVNVATSPFKDKYPGATHALQASIVYQGVPVTVYLYLVLGTSSFTNPGIRGAAGAPGFMFDVILANSPADITYSLPSTFNTSWTSAYTESDSVLLNGSPVFPPTSTTHNARYIVDAYGPMKMPGGGSIDALRMRKLDITSKGASLTYIFLAKNGSSVEVSAADTLQPASGTISASIVSWTGPIPTAVTSAPTAPTQFALLQNSPNPFNPSTRITFTLPHEARVSLKAYNMLGAEVATILEGLVPAGERVVEFNASHLPSGVYLYKLQTEGYMETRKMTLIR
jgi:hypothetical protein